jgi:O-antigen/teichoic acid export membrane protein
MTTLYGAIVAATLGGGTFFTLKLEHLFAVQAAFLGVGWLATSAIGLWFISDCPDAALRQAGPDDEGLHARGVSVRQQMLYALPLLGSALMGTVSILTDKMLVSNRFNSEEFAIYANGAFEVPVGVLLVGAVYGVLMSKLARELGNGHVEEAVRLNRLAVQNIAIIVYPSAVFLAVFSREVMVSLFGPMYASSGWVFLVYALAMLSVLYNPLGLISATGKTRLNLYLSLAALGTNIAMSWLGIVLFGMIGASIGCCTYRFTINLLFARVAAGAMGTTFGRLLPWRELGKTLLVCLVPAVAAAPVLLAPVSSPVRLLLGAVVFGVAYLFVGRKVGLLNAAHTEILLSMVGRLRKR